MAYTELGTQSDVLLSLPSPEPLLQLTGDVNADGSVTIADVTALVDIILGKDNAVNYHQTVADINNDGSITIADVTALVDLILGK